MASLLQARSPGVAPLCFACAPLVFRLYSAYTPLLFPLHIHDGHLPISGDTGGHVGRFPTGPPSLRLISTAAALLGSKKLGEMGRAAKALGKPEAAREVVSEAVKRASQSGAERGSVASAWLHGARRGMEREAVGVVRGAWCVRIEAGRLCSTQIAGHELLELHRFMVAWVTRTKFRSHWPHVTL